MADQESADTWSLSPSGSRSEPDSDAHHLRDPPTLSFSLFAGGGMDSTDYLGLDLGLGFLNPSQQDDGGGVGDWGGDEFFIGRRSISSEPDSGSGSGSGSGSVNDFSRARTVGHDGLRILDFESDSDSDEQIVAIGEYPIISNHQSEEEEMSNPSLNLNLNLPLCWDCLQIHEDRRDINEEFEWEEIDGRFEEREVININNRALDDEEEEDDGRVSNVEWEVLLMNHLGGNSDEAESYLDEGFVYTTTEHDEVMLAQFQEHHDSLLKGSPPAARSAVESLPSVVLTKEDVESNGISCISCAVCKDEIAVEEKAKRLPCLHCYHEECILPWLEMRNTCPLCRYELPTDDPEYERWKARRAGNVGELEVVEDERIRYDFEILPEA